MAVPKYKRHRNGYTMHDGARKRAFGLRPEDKWPKEGMPQRTLETSWGPVVHWVEPVALGHFPRKRALCACPICKKSVEAGHLGQHMSAHEGK